MSAVAGESLIEAGAGSRLMHYQADFGIEGDVACRIAVEVFWPKSTLLPIALFCLPGGAMNRHFYNLDGPDARFSFVRQMAARGFVCVLIDLPGIGDSDRPEDGFALTPDRITGILAQVYPKICGDLHEGNVDSDLPALPQLKTVGVGHSFGAMFTVLQQALGRQHDAIALLGFATHGLPQYLSPDARELAADTDAIRAQLVPLAREMFRESYPEMGSGNAGDMYASAGADRGAVQALKAARDRLLPVPAFMSILPGNVAPEAAKVDVPVFLALGELDFVQKPEPANADFGRSPAVELVNLPDTGHSFFLFESRSMLFDRLAQWARELIDLE